MTPSDSAEEITVPSLHTLRAALRTASLIDSHGSSRRAAQTAYVRDPSGAVFNGDDLRRGEDLLLATGLVTEVESILYPSGSLSELLLTDEADAELALLSTALDQFGSFMFSDPPGHLISRINPHATSAIAEIIPDPERRESFLIALANTTRDQRKELGALGEELVADTARDELRSLGRPELADEVRRVSIFTDALGYDVTAPLITGGSRRLEVKTTRNLVDPVCTFFISRNEFTVGLRDQTWALVICEQLNIGTRVVGWCRASVLSPYVPVDSTGGVWTEARIVLPSYLLRDAIPPAL